MSCLKVLLDNAQSGGTGITVVDGKGRVVGNVRLERLPESDGILVLEVHGARVVNSDIRLRRDLLCECRECRED